MVTVEAAEEALQVALVPRGGFVVAPLELGVPDVGLAVLAPVFGLFVESVGGGSGIKGHEF